MRNAHNSTFAAHHLMARNLQELSRLPQRPRFSPCPSPASLGSQSRRRIRMLRRAAFILVLSFVSAMSYSQTTTYSQAIANNTSGCDKSSANGGPDHCQAVAEPSTDNQTVAPGSTILTKRLVPVPRSINKG